MNNKEEPPLRRNDLNLPTQVVDSIRDHIEHAVRQAEAGYSSAQEAEDAVTGALGEGRQVANRISLLLSFDL